MKHRWLLIAVPLIVLVVSLAGGFGMVWRFFIFLLALLALSRVWAGMSLRGISVRTKMAAGRHKIGDYFEEEFIVSNSSRLPVAALEVREDTDMPDYENIASFNLPSRGSHRWRTRAYCRRRGQYRVGTLLVKAADPLGLFPDVDSLGELSYITVYPTPLELPYFQIIPHLEPGQNLRRWFASESGPSASRVREYVSGDSLRRIHWQTTAHTGHLVVKEFDPDRSHFAFKELWLVPDMYHGTRAGEGDETTEEYCVTITASLANKFIGSEKRVGLIASGGQSHMCLPGTGKTQLQHILQALALMKAGGKVPLDDLLMFQSDRFITGSVLAVIMPSDNPNIAGTLRHMINRGVTVIVILLDSLSFGGRNHASSSARSLVAAGCHVYVVRRGQDIPVALDSRWLSPVTPYFGERLSRV